MKALRRAVFWVFLIAYLIATPIAILYALGYMWVPGAERGLVKTGLIALSSTPDEATIFLGGSRYTRRTPTVIRDLLPGEYALRLSHAGFEDFPLRATILPERATVLDRIILLPIRRDLRPIAHGTWDDLIAAPQSRTFLLRRGDSFFLVDARGPNTGPEEITRLLPGVPDEVALDRRTRAELHVRIQERVFRIDLQEKAIFPDVAPPARRIAVHRGRLLIESLDGQLLRAARDGSAVPAPATVPPVLFRRGAHPLVPSENAEKWLFADGTRIGVVERVETDAGEMDWRERLLYEHTAPIVRVEWAHDDSHVLFSSAGTLWLLALERGGGGPPRAICPIAPRGAFHFDEASGRLFALSPAARLAVLELVPPRTLLPLTLRAEDAP